VTAPASRPGAAKADTAPDYYLSLGDSLAVGVQPDTRGASQPTSHGYPDQLQALLRRHGQVLALVKLGCPGETTATLLHGGLCGYSGEQRAALTGGGSQLAAALGFLRAHPGHVPLITIDIGANDLAPCVERTSAAAAVACAESAIATVRRNTATILAVLTADFQAAHARVADVFTAFQGNDLSGQSTLPGSGRVPTAVARICEWTWACAAPPAGPNAHANTAGYGVIAATFYAAVRG
jgi:lysophospholipase L1-like esterase